MQSTDDDERLTAVVDYLAENHTRPDDEFGMVTLGDLRGLVAFARERLAVNRGLLAQQRQPSQPSETFDLALVTDEDLLREVAARLKR